ncbi:hypothetical protein WA1_23580 [Scytonema hofmannii PCC 7110]|uniref:Beta/gamma crystallin 'Greek key' domain-containing protein n=1 Tax=Scytonema hofmannii PCC 7110 TaxID=128403 RepID=A0A139X8R9_9CYAN|nr:beta/gamma crystallin-related protein [Scytonema hofmannii]KYC41099.1 hypothetical protein WA1_23580 [Scytonema hofmannii PCC 7110]
MLKTKDYFQNLEATPVFQELDDEVAATCSGGRVEYNGPNPDVILYENNFRGGRRLGINATNSDGPTDLGNNGLGVFGNWNDKTSSIEVVRGTWQVYMHTGFRHPSRVLTPGYYPDAGAIGLPNDSISSIRRVG